MAYIAGFGTAGSLLAGAAMVFTLASAVVAFNGWPQIGSQPTPAAVLVSQQRTSLDAGALRRLRTASATLAPTGPAAGRGAAGTGPAGPGSALGPSPAGNGEVISNGAHGIGGGGQPTGTPTSPVAPPGAPCTGCGSGSSPTLGSTVTQATGAVGGAVNSTTGSVGQTATSVTGSTGAGQVVSGVGATVGGLVTGSGPTVGKLLGGH
jgi:hypothetical protein